MMNLFDGIFGTRQRTPSRLRTITVAKPYCTPARRIITGALEPYGVKIYGYNEVIKTVSPIAALRGMKVAASNIETVAIALDPLPHAQVAEITVSEKAAAWAEYLLLRTGKLYVPGRYVNRRNADWARRHGGQMPPQWNKGKPWIEQSCSEGKKAWTDFVKKANRK